VGVLMRIVRGFIRRLVGRGRRGRRYCGYCSCCQDDVTDVIVLESRSSADVRAQTIIARWALPADRPTGPSWRQCGAQPASGSSPISKLLQFTGAGKQAIVGKCEICGL